jgi:solute carrier family 6 (neurotransmitter transporter, glycine) member 5/9
MIDAALLSISNCLTSIFSGFVIFSYIGYLAKQTGQSVDNVVQAGQGLAYVVYPYAVTTIKLAPLWSILFFIMMIVLGIDTLMASVEVTITSFVDLFPLIITKTKLRKQCFIALLCLILFLLGLIFCTQSGTYWIEILDTYSSGWAVLLVGALECISITWFYGFNNFRNDIQAMLGKNITKHKLFNIWKLLWTIIIPIILLILVIFALKDSNKTIIISNTYILPYWTQVLGNLITLSTIVGTIAWIIYIIIDSLFINKKSIKHYLVPNEYWKPSKLKDQIELRKIINNIEAKVLENNGECNKGFSPDLTRF